MGRKILLVTADQQRHDALGCNGGRIARTPVIDGLAATGINYKRAHNQNVVCMPARATIATGQHVRSHGVWMNGVPLPPDQPTVVVDDRGTLSFVPIEEFLQIIERRIDVDAPSSIASTQPCITRKNASAREPCSQSNASASTRSTWAG